MKTMLVLIAVLWAGIGWSDQSIDGPAWFTPGEVGIDMKQCGYERPDDTICYDTATHHVVTPCARKMEAAMLAMEEFTPWGWRQNYEWRTFSETTGPAHEARVKRMDSAVTQWDAVKKECRIGQAQ